MSIHSHLEKKDTVENSMTEFFQKQKTIDDRTDRSHLDQKLQDVIKEVHADREQNADQSITNFFANKLQEQENKQNVIQPTRNTSPWKKPKGDPRTVYNRKDATEREKEQLFLSYYDDNMKLRTNQTKLEQHIKELKTKLRVIEGEYVYSKKKFQGDELIREDLAFIEDLKRENQLLKNQLKDSSHPKPSLPSKTGKQKVIVKSTATGKTVTSGGVGGRTNSDHMRLIDLLKMQLKKAENEIETLHTQMAKRGTSGGQGGIGASDVHDKNVKIATLQHRFENLDGAMNSQKQQYDKLRQQYEDLNKQLYQEKARNNQLEIQVRSAEMAAATAKDLQLQLDEVEREKKMLEAKYKDLIDAPFFKDIGEKAANPARLREAENQLTELKSQLKNIHDNNLSNEKQVVDLKAQVQLVTIEKEKYREEKTRLEAILKERERTQGFMDKQMEVFNMGNDREKDNFIKALGMVRLKGEEPAWKRLEFIERHEELDIKDPVSLLKEIDRLRLEKSEIAAQLEKAQTLLHTHLEMEKEKEIINSAEVNKLQLQLKSANNRIEELVKLADFRARTYKDNLLKTGANYKPYDDGASEFSDITESEISTNENTLDVLVGNCELDELVVRKLLSGKVMDLDGLQTMVAVDFYNHDTQNSEITDGLKPNYNFQLAYRCNVDEQLVNHMENEFLRAEIYCVTGSDLTQLGTCYISYRELLIKNYDVQYGTSAVVNVNGIVYGERKSDIIGVLKVKLRMRHPISEALHWVKERSEFLKEHTDNFDIKMDPTLKSRKLIVQINKISGLPAKSAAFVYYKFYNLRDNCTPTIAGQEPTFNFVSTHDVAQNEAVRKYMEKESLEFVVFDDSVPLRSEGRTAAAALDGMIGRARIKLSPLLLNESIDQVVSIQDLKGRRVANLHVRVHWFDQNEQTNYAGDQNNLTKIWEENFTRNVTSALKMKGQTLDSAFSLFDADSDGRLSFEEFREGILRTFKIKVKEDEIGMYWRRLRLVNDHLTKDEFFMKLGPYFGPEDNMRVTQNRLEGIDDFNRQRHGSQLGQINQMLNKNSENMRSKVVTNQEIVNVLARRLAFYIKENNQPVDFYISKFDRDNNGYLSKAEMRTALNALQIKLTEDEVEDLINYFDINQDGRISVEEFKALISDGVTKELSKQRISSIRTQASTGEDAREEVYKFIADYLKKNNTTIAKFTLDLDADKNGDISRDDFVAFFKKIGMKIEQRELNALFEGLDPKNTGRVSKKQFIEHITPFVSQKPVMTAGIEKSLDLIAEKIQEKGVSPQQYFNKVDADHSGFLDRKELKQELLNMGLQFSDIEIDNLMDYWDNSKDGRVNLREFVDQIEPRIKQLKALRTQSSKRLVNTSTTSNKIINDLKGKCHAIVSKHYSTILQGLNIFKESSTGPALVTKENFKKAFEAFNLGFLPSELDLILGNLVEENGDGLVYYERFLNDYNDPKSAISLSESRMLNTSGYGDKSASRLSNAEDIFSRINKVLKENKISAKDAFKVFDKDGNGKISLQEFRDAFAGMKLNLSKSEIEDVIKHVDKGKDGRRGDGQIDYNEFIQALKL